MNYKWLMGAVLPVFLVSCGGGTKSDGLSGREPGILFKVNGVEVANETTINAQYFSADVSSVENCGTVDVPLFDNYSAITASGQNEYCDGVRSAITPAVIFQVSYINSTYQPITLNYTGVGFTIRIYDSSNNEVWNSDAAQYLANKAAQTTDDYDPAATHSIVLGAQDSFPSITTYGTSFRVYNFAGDQNFNYGVNGDSLVLGTADQQIHLMNYTSGDPANSLCNLALVDKVLSDGTTSGSNNVYDKPLCQTEPMSAGTYTAIVTFNFNGDIQTRTVHINLSAPVS